MKTIRIDIKFLDNTKIKKSDTSVFNNCTARLLAYFILEMKKVYYVNRHNSILLKVVKEEQKILQ